MNLNYMISVDFFLYVKNIKHQTLASFLLLTSIKEEHADTYIFRNMKSPNYRGKF